MRLGKSPPYPPQANIGAEVPDFPMMEPDGGTPRE